MIIGLENQFLVFVFEWPLKTGFTVPYLHVIYYICYVLKLIYAKLIVFLSSCIKQEHFYYVVNYFKLLHRKKALADAIHNQFSKLTFSKNSFRNTYRIE